MRPIDADALINWLDTEIDTEEWAVSQFNADWIYCFIDNALTIDTVEVTRCKDCKYFTPYKIPNIYYCDWHRDLFETFPDDYCSHGERREP